MIPQFQPIYNRKAIAKEVNKYILGNNFFSENLKTKEFEQALAQYLNVKHVVTVTSGTMALVLALLAEGVKPGDKVLIPNITMMSTQSAVELIGAVPVFIDVDPDNLCMKLNDALSKISSEIKAIIMVHLNGRSHGMMEYMNFLRLCAKNEIKVIEDNAQAFGSRNDFNDLISHPSSGIGCFSLSFHKLLSSGQGGFCVTNNDELNIKLRELKNVGRVEGGADIHERFGINCKFTDIQAIIGLTELKDIEEKINKKKAIYNTYQIYLGELPEISFIETNLTFTTPWFIDIYVDNPQLLQEYLKINEIGTRLIYPELTSQKLNQRFLLPKSLKVSEKYTKKGIWLPSSLNLTTGDICFICDIIKEFYGK